MVKPDKEKSDINDNFNLEGTSFNIDFAERLRKRRTGEMRDNTDHRKTKIHITVTWGAYNTYLNSKYIDYRLGSISEGKYRNIASAVNKFMSYLTDRFGDREKFKVTEEDVWDFFVNLDKYTVTEDNKLSYSTINKDVLYVRDFLDYVMWLQGVQLYLKDLTTTKVVKILEKQNKFKHAEGHAKKSKKKLLKDVNFMRIVEQNVQILFNDLYFRYSTKRLNERTYDFLRLVILLGVYNGLRGTEMARIKVDDINLENRLMDVHRGKIDVKKNITTTVLHPLVRDYIKYIIEKYNLKEEDKLIPVKNIDQFIKQHCNKLVNLRMLRSFFAVRLEAHGQKEFLEYLLGHKEGIKIVSKFLRDSALTKLTTDHYTQEFIRNLKQSYDTAFNDLIFEIHLDDNPTPHIFPTPAKNKYPAH